MSQLILLVIYIVSKIYDIYAYIYIHIYMHIHTNICVNIYIYTDVDTYTWIIINKYACIYIYNLFIYFVY